MFFICGTGTCSLNLLY